MSGSSIFQSSNPVYGGQEAADIIKSVLESINSRNSLTPSVKQAFKLTPTPKPPSPIPVESPKPLSPISSPSLTSVTTMFSLPTSTTPSEPTPIPSTPIKEVTPTPKPAWPDKKGTPYPKQATPIKRDTPVLLASPKPTKLPSPSLSLSQYKLNIDPNPEIIRKKTTEKLKYTQEISLRYLKPPALEKAGDIVIRQEKNVQVRAAPPLIIRQKAPTPIAPSPLVIREKPPVPPSPISPKLIVIPGKVMPPPARKVIVERLPLLPTPPQNILVERWLGYDERERRVVFQPAPPLTPSPAQKNVLIQWESPDVEVSKDFKALGIAEANPAEYTARYGSGLVETAKLPEVVVANFKAPEGHVFGSDYKPKLPKLVGDLHALGLIDLDKVGLSEYKSLFPAAQASASLFASA